MVTIANCEPSQCTLVVLYLNKKKCSFDIHLFHEILQEDGLDAEVFNRLREAHVEAENSKHEAYKESLKRQKAESDAIDALIKVRLAKEFSNFLGIGSIYIKNLVSSCANWRNHI